MKGSCLQAALLKPGGGLPGAMNLAEVDTAVDALLQGFSGQCDPSPLLPTHLTAAPSSKGNACKVTLCSLTHMGLQPMTG